jgi:hypothetical protein
MTSWCNIRKTYPMASSIGISLDVIQVAPDGAVWYGVAMLLTGNPYRD